MFEHEKLLAYDKALRVAILLESVSIEISRRRLDLADQLRRASASIPLNLAEGANEYSPAEKVRFYRIARRSAAECAAILDLGAHVSTPPIDVTSAKRDLNEVIALLTRLIQSQPAKR